MKHKFISGYHPTAHGGFDEKDWLEAFKDESVTVNEVRQEAGLTQKELAAIVGVNVKTIKRWEKENKPANLAVCRAVERDISK